MTINLGIIAIVFFCALLAATGQIFFKLASSTFSFNPLSWFQNGYFLLGGALYALSAILFVWSLKYGNLSILYPIIATSYVWVVLFSVLVLGESFSLFKWVGIGLIILGVIIIVR